MSSDVQIQPTGFLLELSPDWLILRASENVHKFLKEYHATLIGEPLADFTLAQPLHDLRNSLTRQRSSSGIARAYRVRLIEEPRHFDFAFQLSEGRILLEGIPSADGYGASLGSISRLIEGVAEADRGSLAEAAARRMRALTGFDRVDLMLNRGAKIETTQSSRGVAGRLGLGEAARQHPLIVPDTTARPVPLFPRDEADRAPQRALLRSPPREVLSHLHEAGVESLLTVPIVVGGETAGAFTCADGKPREPTFELHAAAELFAQVLAMRLQLDGA